ncbi:MAG: hypothetical protein ACK5Q5_04760 [Planctomycetaceae bacterium]
MRQRAKELHLMNELGLTPMATVPPRNHEEPDPDGDEAEEEAAAEAA